ncbi:hypothetical protein J1605_004335 [Eschrichtius robustus]|uniref:Uncharacterized protein n=1 Tax=Eschrichtius robustus TaxID=9764 RepID=A0AB34HGI2_ESCRO|nr:hypothetical protein J1605_004335 [Eschrichtius robustus]
MISHPWQPECQAKKESKAAYVLSIKECCNPLVMSAVEEKGETCVMHASHLSFPASLVAQCLRIRLPMQGTRVRALVREDPTCRGATKPVHHSY